MRHVFGPAIDRFSQRRILVLGDMVADEYVMGRPARISREAPVLILHYAGSFVRLGGATNTAYNLSCLGASTRVVGIIGDDEMGRRLREALADAGIDTTCLLIDDSRPTSTKTRIVGKGSQQEVQQQIVRIDRVDSSPISSSMRDDLIDGLCRSLLTVDAILVSDYENGVISPEVIGACLPLARERGIATVVDSHGDLFRFRGVTAATPNQPEAASSLDRALESEADLDAAGAALLEGMQAESVLITRGSEGVVLYRQESMPYRLPIALSSESEVVDPTGAGDTVAAVFTLALTSGMSPQQAAYLSNVAGGEVVRRLGAAALSPSELEDAASRTKLETPL